MVNNNNVEKKFKSIPNVVNSPLFILSIILAAVSLVMSLVTFRSTALDLVATIMGNKEFYNSTVVYAIIKNALYIPLILEIAGLVIVKLTVAKGSDDDTGVNVVKMGMAVSIFMFFIAAVILVVGIPVLSKNVHGVSQFMFYIILLASLAVAIAGALFFKVFIDVTNIGFESMARSTISEKMPLVFIISILVVAAVLAGSAVFSISLYGLDMILLPVIACGLRVLSYLSFLFLMMDISKEVK
ncbi:MAG: hypothetical protein E7405_05510 [Ruminococcaceae bacterium]|nr:hypothetical protein [Oscillospiraceae bacterium]